MMPQARTDCNNRKRSNAILVSEEDLNAIPETDNYQSRTRNKLIAEAFYLTKDIEKYGSGYIRVREALKSYNTMEFDYEENADGYLVTLSYTEQKTTQEKKHTTKRGLPVICRE